MSHPWERSAPYISVVVAARNDNHGGNMLTRMQAFIDSWLGQSKRYSLPSEIIVVEWNPPPDRAKLADELRWPSDTTPCDVRFIEVPAEIHQTFANSAAIPLHQMIAKNVGIRRSRGEYVLGTNLDIVFSSELMQFLAARQLEPGVMYRIDRHDVSSGIPAEATLDELLAFCNNHILRVFTREGGFALTPPGLRALEQHDIVEPDAGLHFGPGWYRPESDGKEWFRWIGIEAEFYFEKPQWASPQLLMDAEIGPSSGGESLTFEIAGDGGSLLADGRMDGRCQIRLQLPDSPSTGTLRLRTLGGGLPLEHQSRILNLRIFKVEWVAGAAKTSNSWGLEVLRTGPAFDWHGTYAAPSPFAAQMRNAAHLHIEACGDFTLLSRES